VAKPTNESLRVGRTRVSHFKELFTLADACAVDHPWRYSKVRFEPLHIPLSVTVDGNEGTALGVFYAETDQGWPNEAKLIYLVSFPEEARPRLVGDDKITAHRLSD
jgi:hypothetical protein